MQREVKTAEPQAANTSAEAPELGGTRTLPVRRQANRLWFDRRMRDYGLDRDVLAALYGKDGNSIWTLLSGRRKNPNPDEIALLAKELHAPYMEIVKQLGFSVTAQTVPVIGALREKGRVYRDVSGTNRQVEAPPGAGEYCKAISVVVSHSILGLMEGSFLFYEPKPTARVQDTHNRLSVIEIGDDGSPMFVGMLLRGDGLPHMRIAPVGTEEIIETRQLNGAWPLLWQKF